MSTVLYEHPLNERIRNYLKLEQLFAQAHSCLSNDIHLNHQVFFNSLFAITDTLERCDIRGDLIKDMEKLEQNLVLWSKSPDINSSALDSHLRETVKLIAKLRLNKPIWYQLKENKFLAGLKQRFAIQGGSSSFDLPQLTFWLHQPLAVIEHEVSGWLGLLDDIQEALALVLRFIRQRSNFETVETDSGFYQDNGEGILLLRIKLDSHVDYYPTISGNKFRYSIRFMMPCQHTGRRYSNQATSFRLARC